MGTERTRGSRVHTGIVWGYCILIATGCLLICSKSSFLYPINDWADTNIFFTMGKGMANGLVIYRDLYDHKGPLLYAMYALCYAVAPLSFAGVFALEVLCFSLFLLSAYKLLRVYDVGHAAWLAVPVLGFAVASSLSFQQGGSAEELCLPMLSWSLLSLLTYLKNESPKRMKTQTLVWNGVLCGCVLWVKFTMLGLHAPWIAAAFLCAASQKQWKEARRRVVLFAAGIALATVPWIVYFGAHGALHVWFKTYVYDNLFLYAAGAESPGIIAQGRAILQSGWAWLTGNPGYTALVLAGMAWFLRKAAPWEKGAMLLSVGICALGVFIGGKSYLYYGLILAVFAAPGLIPLCRWLEARTFFAHAQGKKRMWLCAVLSALCIALCYPVSPNTQTSFLQPKEETMQYRIAAAIQEPESATLLNYGFMDAGFYTAAGITPGVKYFHQTNVPLQEMLDEQIRYIEDGICTYVVTRGKQPDGMEEQYILIATADSPGFWYEKVYLYRLP